MKKTALVVILSVACLVAQSAWATITFTATPSSQTVAAGGTFNVTLQLSVSQSSSPAHVSGFDMIWEALASQNGGISNTAFSITGASTTLTGWAAIATYPDPITTAGSTHSGFVQNSQDNGFTAGNDPQAIATPFSSLNMATYTFSIASNVAPGTYTFSSTALATSGAKRSRISGFEASSAGGVTSFNPDVGATFTITVVPEPATWSLLGLGGLGSLGLTLLRARRRS